MNAKATAWLIATMEKMKTHDWNRDTFTCRNCGLRMVDGWNEPTVCPGKPEIADMTDEWSVDQ